MKIGSRVLTSKGEGLDFEVISQLVEQISDLAHAGKEVFVVSSGAVAAGIKELKLKDLPRTIPQKQAVAAVGQSHLIWAYEWAFKQHRRHVAQVLLTHEDLRQRARYLNARNTLLTLIRLGTIPIINENDTVSVEEIQLGDNDSLSAMVADLVQADLLLILTDIEGVYTADPSVDPTAAFLADITRVTPAIEAMGVYRITPWRVAACHQDSGGEETGCERHPNHRRQWLSARNYCSITGWRSVWYTFSSREAPVAGSEALDRHDSAATRSSICR